MAKHLSNTYGDRADEVAKLAKVTGKRWPVIGKRLVEDLPYIEAEVIYKLTYSFALFLRNIKNQIFIIFAALHRSV